MDYQEAIKEAETQINVYESMILYNKDFEKKNDNSNYERKIDFLKTAISAMQELQEYKKLGTLEEVREAVEKLKAKKPKKDCVYHHPTRWCEKCNRVVMSGWEYCPDCGQRIDWSEEE